PAIANPNFPVSGFTRVILAFGSKVVLHSPSARTRAASTPISTGRNSGTTQAGLETARRSVLLASEIHDSTLQAPTSSIAASSTANAPPAAGGWPDSIKTAARPAARG